MIIGYVTEGIILQNPLKAEILDFLQLKPNGTTEYEIIKMLEEKQYFYGLADESELALFQKHFITMNALYQLQISLWKNDRIFLDITSIRVSIIEAKIKDNKGSEITETAAVREYYLDWKNYEATDQEQVLKMLTSFWEMFYNQDKVFSAYETLKLSQYEPFDVVKKQYRRLAIKYHPDKGGNQTDFIALRKAFEIIKQTEFGIGC